MSGPGIICKAGYITSVEHFLNWLDYAGGKIWTQEVIYQDGSRQAVPADEIIRLDADAAARAKWVRIRFKDGHFATIPYDRYREKTSETQEVIKVDEVREIERANDADPREMKELNFFQYLPYIAEREGVVKEDGYGLFGCTPGGFAGNIATEDAKNLGITYADSRKWSFIISPPGEESRSRGLDHRAAWKDIVLSHRNDFARAYNISPENLVINCGFHCNTDNCHIHLLIYSTDPTEGFVKGGNKGMQKASEKVKSIIAGEVYKEERAAIGRQKDAAKEEIAAFFSQLSIPQELEEQAAGLTAEITALSGKKVYGFLPPELKSRTNSLLHDLLQLPPLQDAFDKYRAAQEQFIRQYIGDETRIAEKMQDFRKQFFQPQKGRATAQNLLIDALLQEHPAGGAESELAPAGERTAEEKMANDSIRAAALSSLPADLEEPIIWSDEWPKQGREEGPVGERTAERKIVQDTAGVTPLSSDYRKARQEIEQYLQSCQGTVKFGTISGACRKALAGILDKSVDKTDLQGLALSLLREIKQPENQQQLFRLLYTTDSDFHTRIDAMIDESEAQLLRRFGNQPFVQSYLHQLREAQMGGDPAYSLCAYFRWLKKPENMALEEAWNLLRDHAKELEHDTPLRQCVRESMLSLLRGNHILLQHELDALAEQLTDPDGYDQKELARHLNTVRPFFSAAENPRHEEYNKLMKEYYADAEDLFARHGEISVPAACTAQFHRMMNTANRLTPLHSSILWTAQRYKEMLADKLMREPAVVLPLTRALSTAMAAALQNPGGLFSGYLRQQLVRISDKATDPEEAAQATMETERLLYELDPTVRDAIDAGREYAYAKLKELYGAEEAGKVLKEHIGSLEKPETDTAARWILRQSAENLSLLFCEANRELIQDDLKELRQQIYQQVRSASNPKSDAHKIYLRLQEDVLEKRPLDVAELLYGFSDEKSDLIAQTRKMFDPIGGLAEDMEIPLSPDDFNRYVCEEDPYCNAGLSAFFSILAGTDFPARGPGLLRAAAVLAKLLSSAPIGSAAAQMDPLQNQNKLRGRDKFRRRNAFSQQEGMISPE